MKLEIELPEELVAELDRQVSLTAKDRSGVIMQLLEQLLRSNQLYEQAQSQRVNVMGRYDLSVDFPA